MLILASGETIIEPGPEDQVRIIIQLKGDPVAAYKSRHGRVPEKYAQAGYDTVHMIAQAISRAKSTQPAAVRDALTQTQYAGPQGKAFFDKTNQLIIDEYIISVKDGKFVVEAGPVKAVD